MWHILFTTLYTHFFITVLGRKLSPFYLLLANLSHLSYLHLRRMVVDFKWSIEITTCFMMTFCKFSNLAFSYDDGGLKDDSKLKSYHKEKKVIDAPSIYETFGYVFFYPTSVIGPSFEFSDFKNFINKEKEYKDIPFFKAFLAAINEFFNAIILIVIFLIGSRYFEPYWMATDDFGAKGWLYKIFYISATMTTYSCKYYIAWKFTECGTVMSGLGYNPTKAIVTSEDKSTKTEVTIHNFDKIFSIKIYAIEVLPNPKDKIRNWNYSVHMWLKFNVFFRLIQTGNETLIKYASILTFMTSAIWHGFFLNYYITFTLYFLYEQIGLLLEKKYDIFNVLEAKSYILWILFGAVLKFFAHFAGIIFLLIDYKSVYLFNLNTGFVPLILFFVIYLVLLVVRGNKHLHHHNHHIHHGHDHNKLENEKIKTG